MKKSTKRWAKRGITHWLEEDLSVNIIKWRSQGHKIHIPTQKHARKVQS